MGRSAIGVAVAANAGGGNPADLTLRNGKELPIAMLDSALRLD